MVKRTVLYVAGFGLGTLTIILVLSLTVTAIAESVLPSSRKSDDLEPGATVEPIITAAPRTSRPTSPLAPGRRRLPPRPGGSGSLGQHEPAAAPGGPTEPTLAPAMPDGPLPVPNGADSLTKRSRANGAQRPTYEQPL
jgi:hypothetical protein